MIQTVYLTGATGFLGRAVSEELHRKGYPVRALVLENDPLRAFLPAWIQPRMGDVSDRKAVDRFLEDAGENDCVIHCAGIVSVASRPGEALRRVNVTGTQNLAAACRERGVGKLIYVSSVHAIPEKPRGERASEAAEISPELVRGAYAKSKAAATRIVMEGQKRGLSACIVFPSGIIGPGDEAQGSITRMLLSFLAGKLPFAVRGGYDFVDVRDVARGVVSAAEKGEPGERFILSGHYATIREMLECVKKTSKIRRFVTYLPIVLAQMAAPLAEKIALKQKKPPFFTPYSVAVLQANALFSHQNATQKLGYEPRSLQKTMQDTVKWLQKREKRTENKA